MKILLLIPYISDVYGGTGKVVRDLAQALGDRGLQVDIVTTDANDTGKLDVPHQTWVQHPGYRLQYFPCWHRYDQTWSGSLLRWLTQHLHEYTVVHAHTLFGPMLSVTYWLCQRRGIPYVMTPHGMLEPWAIAQKAVKKALYLKFLEKPALARAAAIQVLTEREAHHLHQLGFTQTQTIPNGLHLEPWQQLPPAAQFYQQFPATKGKSLLLFLSRLDPKKGLDLLAPALARLRPQFPAAHLVLAGPDSIGYRPTVEQFFATAGCADAVTFTGMLTGDLKRAAFQAAQVYVLPSYSEGFSVSVLEAMAAGLPCIITTECNFPEAAIAQAAHVIPPTAAALAEALAQCLHDPDTAAAMGQRARQLVTQQYTWAQVAHQLTQVYDQVVRAPAQPRSRELFPSGLCRPFQGKPRGPGP